MEPIIKVDNVSMCFNLSTEKHESLKEYLLAMVQGRLQYDEARCRNRHRHAPRS